MSSFFLEKLTESFIAFEGTLKHTIFELKEFRRQGL